MCALIIHIVYYGSLNENRGTSFTFGPGDETPKATDLVSTLKYMRTQHIHTHTHAFYPISKERFYNITLEMIEKLKQNTCAVFIYTVIDVFIFCSYPVMFLFLWFQGQQVLNSVLIYLCIFFLSISGETFLIKMFL